MTRYAYDVLAFWRQGSKEEAQGMSEQQAVARQLQVAGNGIIRAAITATHASHGFNYVGVASQRPKPDKITELQQRLRVKYDLLWVPYPPGASPETLRSMQEGLRAGANVLAEVSNELVDREGIQLEEAVDHHTGALYVPGATVILGSLWIPEELRNLSETLPLPAPRPYP